MTTNVLVKTWLGCKAGDTAGIATQAGEIAALFAEFVNQTKTALHIAIYDFRLDPAQASVVISALNTIAERGCDVRVAYFQQPRSKDTHKDGGDPSPGTKASDFRKFHQQIRIKAIKGVDINALPRGVKKEPIEGGGHLMHSKYMVRDDEAVWMGSANFTTDAWSIQDNNVVQLVSADLARCYETDFSELWASGRIAGTGKNDLGKADVDGEEIDVAFSPGEGSYIEKAIAGAIMDAKESVAVASMVISSGAIMGALADAIGRGVKVRGVYDGPEMANVLRDWAKGAARGTSAGKKEQWNALKSSFVAKASTPYTPSGPHDFMHNKFVSVDTKLVVTGSFNFSQNATHNAENVITLHNPAIATEYETYVDELIAAYAPGAGVTKVRRAVRARATGRKGVGPRKKARARKRR